MRISAFVLLALPLFVSLSFAASYTGDGTYTLNVSDTIDSSNGFHIVLSGVSWHYTGQQSVVLDNANYTIAYKDSVIATPSLSQGASYTASTTDWQTQKNVTVTPTSLGYIMVGGLTASIVVPYATTQASSASYTPPEIDFQFTSVTASADKFEATVTWSTNVSANGTVYLMNSSGGTPWYVANFPALEATRSKKFQSIKSNTQYFYVVKIMPAS